MFSFTNTKHILLSPTMVAEKFKSNISNLKSFLSPKVYLILCNETKYEQNIGYCQMLTDGFINWNEFDEVLQCEDSVEDFQHFNKQAISLQNLFHECEHFVDSLESWDEFNRKHTKHFNWISHLKMIKRCFHLLKESKSGEVVLKTLLLLVSILERGLGDIIFSEINKCPNILRDILLTEQLRSILSPTVVRFLRLLIGPPTSLNLRNVAWHGFIGLNEVQRRYSCVIFCTILSIGKMLSEKKVVDSMKQRPFLLFPDVIIGDNHLVPLDEIKEQFFKFSKLLPTMETMWHHSLDLFAFAKYGECVIILLPLMEHMLRCVFAIIHDDLERVLTAETETLFTTFDEMLAHSLPNGEKNKMSEFFGESFMMAMMDSLVYHHGPRVRDRVSHGEVDPDTINRNHALSIMTLCCVAQRKIFECKESKNSDSYSSQHHPISVLREKIVELSIHLDGLKFELLKRELIKEEMSFTPLKECDTNNRRMKAIFGSLTYNIDMESKTLASLLNGLKLRTLYRYELPIVKERKEKEFISSFDSIVSQCQSNVDGVLIYIIAMEDRLKDKLLRSRQRSTYEVLLSSLPILICIIYASISLAVHFLINIQDIDYCMSPQQILILQKSIKELKKFNENFDSCFQKHKWLDLRNMAVKILNEETK